ncbi:hypothetical protein N7468_009868 [Penicillium chermesinum]|uniref:Uncharacterized protein n=1 Tax=Penicillium chermesinum TaxID=63820 RepID=A0A9W9TCT2_9EURO|nr:uncharacterized protein N7468_009868 [Penicillium chermesinum]KAJ5216860.1 hypothetical protein N7468_009868 [Penicillium chermesinum]
MHASALSDDLAFVVVVETSCSLIFDILPPLLASGLCIVTLPNTKLHSEAQMAARSSPNEGSKRLSNEILCAAAEGFLRAYGSWCLESLDVENIKHLDACQSAQEGCHKGGPDSIVQSELLASQVAIIARQQPRENLALLAHIAWYYDGRYGLPEGKFDRTFEVESLNQLYGLFKKFHSCRNLPQTLLEYILQKREVEEWATSVAPEKFKRITADVMLSLRESLITALKLY